MKTSLANAALFDCEIFENYFLAAFKSVRNGKVKTFEKSARSVLDRPGLRQIMHDYCTVGFNSINFDMVIVSAALAGFGTKALKRITNDIIYRGAKPWEIAREYDFSILTTDHVDLIEIAPGKNSLKIYNGKMHGKRMQDLPFDPESILTPEQMDITADYCVNDLDATGLLMKTLSEQLTLREQMSKEYGVDLRSKSDAQIAEAVIKAELKRLTGEEPRRPKLSLAKQYKYPIPDFIQYVDPQLNAMLDVVRESDFALSPSGKMIMPDALKKMKIRIGSSVYRMGIGGLHSSEKTTAYVAAGGGFRLFDRDVTGYYPQIIINLGLFPQHLGRDFLRVYKSLVDRRNKAKASTKTLKDKIKVAIEALKIVLKKELEPYEVKANSLKIVNNGSFGKFGNQYSVLFAPDLMIRTTITGQLSLLMLIEIVEAQGLPVVSANTDGIVIKCPEGLESSLSGAIGVWEDLTGFATEETEYRALYSRDVNNYIAVKTDDSVKKKGAYADPVIVASSWPSPLNEVCTDAVVAFVTKGTPLRETIRGCKDIRRFVTIRTVQGGAVKDDEYLGKAIRWYYATDAVGCINYKRNGNKVPRSDGAKPLMTLPDEFPDDVDHAWYVAEAESILEDIGYRKLVPARASRDLLFAAVL